MDDLSWIAKTGLVNVTEVPEGEPARSDLRFCASIADTDARAIVDRFDDALAQIAALTSYSEEGKVPLRAVAATQGLEGLAKYDATIGRAEKALAKLREAFQPPEVPADKPSRTLEMLAVRKAAFELSPERFQDLWSRTCREGTDRTTFDAIRTAPSWMLEGRWLVVQPGVDPIEEGVATWMELKDSAAAAAIGRLATAVEAARVAVSHARSHIVDQAGLKADPIAELAAL